MQVVLVILSVGLLGLIISYAVSRKSSRGLRLASLIALGVIGLSLAVASIYIALNTFAKESDEGHLPTFLNAPPEPSKKANTIEIVVFLAVLAVIIALIVVIASNDRKRRLAEAKKAPPSPLFRDAKPDDLDLKPEPPPKPKDDFDLDLG